jgi:ATP-dependent helicase/nuclease subunit B
VLPNADLTMSDEAWAAVEPSHAQAGIARLLKGLGATRGDIATHWTGTGSVPPDRFGVLSRVLLPAASMHDWMDETRLLNPAVAARLVPAAGPGTGAAAVDPDKPDHDGGGTPSAPLLSGIARLRPSGQQQEAQSIALVLRQAVETPGARAALITPDRDLAGRVAAALLRFGIVADDSAGEKLADSPPAVFLRLLVGAVAGELAPVPLLALLKHPLAAAGLAPVVCRDAARRLEVAILRGPRPGHGVAGLRLALDRAGRGGTKFLTRLETCLEPLLRIDASMEIGPAAALSAAIEAAERLAATDTETGAARLWAHEEGEALATRLAEVRDAAGIMPGLKRGVLPGWLDAILDGEVVRSRRALRGRGGFEHPRVFIWGLLEARLQSVDVAVLGGLAETVWPPAADPGPWLSRPMRKKIGLPSPEEAVGQAAHDFLSACCCAPVVVLSCPERRDNAPAVPARWLTRLDMFLAGRGAAVPAHPAAVWADAMDLPADGAKPVRPPEPAPPLAKRPRKLSVTEIETWLRDPYAIHAKHILRLRALKPLDEATDAADYGSIVHDGLDRFLRRHGAAWPPDAVSGLRTAMAQALAESGLRQALVAWWSPRLERIADWVAATEAERRTKRAPVTLATETSGRTELHRPGGSFQLTGRADRIERYADGTLTILDDKTGRPPSQQDVDDGLAPQLLLEAMMAAEGAFGADHQGSASELLYWHLSGGLDPGKAMPLFRKVPDEIPGAVLDARDLLCMLIDDFDRPERSYLSCPHPGHAPRFSDYAQLARVAEWSASGDGDE